MNKQDSFGQHVLDVAVANKQSGEIIDLLVYYNAHPAQRVWAGGAKKMIKSVYPTMYSCWLIG